MDESKEESRYFNAHKVVVTDIHMSMSSMVKFMVKWAIASIPATIILIFLGIVAYFAWYGIIKAIVG